MTTLTSNVASSAMILPLAISTVERLRSVSRVFGVRGGNAYHDKKDTKNPSQEKKNTFPWRQRGFYAVSANKMHGSYQNWHPPRFVVNGINLRRCPQLTDTHGKRHGCAVGV